MERRSLKTDNSGISLLEVIIAVSIFSIAAIVLFQGFITSGRINRKSNLYLEATSTAQNIMEEIKAKDFPELSRDFNYPLDPFTGFSHFSFQETKTDLIRNGNIGIGELMKNNKGELVPVRLFEHSGDDKSNVTASVISEDGGRTYEFNPRLTGENASKYYFEMTNLTHLHESFDALIEFDGSADSGYKKKTSASDVAGKNDYQTPNIAKMNTKTDAFLIMEKNWDENAMKAIVSEQNLLALAKWNEKYGMDENAPAKPEVLSPDEVYEYTGRTLTIRLKEEAGIVQVDAKYTLQAYGYQKQGGTEFETMNICPCKGKGPVGVPEGGKCICTYESPYFPIYSTETDKQLKNLYLFYYPNYHSVSGSNPLDEIILDNTMNYPLNFYVVKQREDDSGKPTSTEELSYRMALTVIEDPSSNGNPNWNTNPSLFDAQTKLRTNLDYNISDLNDTGSRPKINQMKITYKAENQKTNTSRKVTSSSAKAVLDFNGLDDRKSGDRIYTAKVSIYKQGAAERQFPEEDLIVTLDGAKEN